MRPQVHIVVLPVSLYRLKERFCYYIKPFAMMSILIQFRLCNANIKVLYV